MKTPLRLLLVEDSQDDADLLLRELTGHYDLTCRRVETAETMRAALDEHAWDIVISDYSLPTFSAPQAFEVLRQKGLDLPFIIVSGTVGEETAVEAMRAGARDYLLKGSFKRLVVAVEREVREARLRSERRNMREQLLLSDRMVSIGTLAAGVAHEINNPLAALMVNQDLAVRELASLRAAENLAQVRVQVRELEERLQEAREASERIRQIVRDLKLFSRRDEVKREPVDVRRVMESSLRMAWNEIRHRARVVKDFGEVSFVYANEAKLGQVFLNLLVNAAQAMPEGKANSNQIRIVMAMDPEGRVVIEVRDTGPGIPPENRARIFEAFFTTKPIGVGTGLGLSICHRIIAELAGEIAVESSPGHETVFRVILPIGGSDLPKTKVKGKGSPHALPSRRGRILVVDDEASISKAIERMLRRQHDVTAITSGQEALAKFQAGERYDAILCDLMMPVMTGMDLHAELLRSFPDQADKMVFLTGGAFTPRARAFLDEVPNARLEKPFELQNLVSLISERLR